MNISECILTEHSSCQPSCYSSASTLQIAELERQLASVKIEKSKLMKENIELIVKNTDLARKCEDIDWYKWLGEWMGRLTSTVASVCTLDGLSALFANKSFIRSIMGIVNPVLKSPIGMNAVAVGVIALSALIGFWLYKVENKKLKAKAFFKGTWEGLNDLTSESAQAMKILFERFCLFFNKAHKMAALECKAIKSM